jgi:hypothetical protein
MPPPLKLPQFRAIFACVASEGGEIACSSYPSINSLFGSEIPLLALAQFPASLHGNLLGFL